MSLLQKFASVAFNFKPDFVCDDKMKYHCAEFGEMFWWQYTVFFVCITDNMQKLVAQLEKESSSRQSMEEELKQTTFKMNLLSTVYHGENKLE